MKVNYFKSEEFEMLVFDLKCWFKSLGGERKIRSIENLLVKNKIEYKREGKNLEVYSCENENEKSVFINGLDLWLIRDEKVVRMVELKYRKMRKYIKDNVKKFK